MIRAHLTQKPQGAVQELLDEQQREKNKQEALATREMRLLKGAKAMVLKHDGGKMDKYMSYGGPTAKTVAFEASPGEQYSTAFRSTALSTVGSTTPTAVCGDVYILDAQGRVVSRTSFPYSLLTYQKAWIEIPDFADQGGREVLCGDVLPTPSNTRGSTWATIRIWRSPIPAWGG